MHPSGEQLLWTVVGRRWWSVSVGIYGPGRTRLIDSVRDGSAVGPVGPPVFTNRIHRDDCARVLEHLLFLPDPAPLYLAVDDDPVRSSRCSTGWLPNWECRNRQQRRILR